MDKSEKQQLKALIRKAADTFIMQRRPVTVAIALVSWDGLEYFDWGYSKVSQGDHWNHERGSEIAIGRAVDNLYYQILGGSKSFYALADTPLGVKNLLPMELAATLAEIIPSISG